MASRLVEAARELAIGIVFELGGDDRALPREEQELVILAQSADFIRREQRASDMLRSERYAGFVAVDRAAHGLEHDRHIGSASCRERVCQYVYITVVAVSIKKNK